MDIVRVLPPFVVVVEITSNYETGIIVYDVVRE